MASQPIRRIVYATVLVTLFGLLFSLYSTASASPAGQGGGTVTGIVVGTVPTTGGLLTTCSVSPASTSLQPGQTQAFTYVAMDKDHAVITSLVTITWAKLSPAPGGGTLSTAAGATTTFTAGNNVGTFQIRATGVQGASSCSPSASTIEVTVPTPTPTATSTPLPTATATPTPTPIPTVAPTATVVAAVTKAETKVAVAAAPVVSSAATAKDAAGQAVTLTAGQTIQVTTTSVVIPAAVAAGVKLDSFTDPTTGTTIKKDATTGKNQLVIPLKDEQNATTVAVVVTLGDVVGTGTTAAATVEKVKLTTAEQKVDLTTAKPTVGKVSASLDVDLKAIPQAASLTVAVAATPDPKAQAAFVLEALNAGTTLKEVAYVINVTKENLANTTVVGEARITMRVSKAWVALQGGAQNVRITRYGDDGSVKILPIKIIGEDSDGNIVFEGTSTGGLSVFGLVALQAAPSVPPPDGGALRFFSAAGTTLTSPDGAVSVVVKDGSTSGTRILAYAPKTSAQVAKLTGTLQAFGSQVFSLEVWDDAGKAISGFTFLRPIAITVTYTAADVTLASGNPGFLTIMQYDDQTKAWGTLLTTVDIVGKKATAEASHLSNFALVAQPPVPTPTYTPTKTATPTSTPVTAILTPVTTPPKVGGTEPSSSFLIGLLVLAIVFIAAGTYYLRQPRGRATP